MAPWDDAPPRENAAPPSSSPPEPAQPPSRSRTKTVIGVAALTAAVSAVSATAGGLIGGYAGYRAADPQRAVSTYTLTPASAVSSKRPAVSLAGIAASALPGVVMVKVDGGQCIGSGFVVSGGYIITNNHVVTMDGAVRPGHAALRVVFNNGQSAPARLMGADPYSDIAVIRANTSTPLTALPLGNSGTVGVGDPVMAVGSPLGLNGTVTSGIVSALNRPVQPGGTSGTAADAFIDAIQTDAAINPGNSGGPLLNSQGQVIGVNAAIASVGYSVYGGGQSGSIGIGFAIPINQASQVAEQLVRNGKAAHAVIGALINGSYTGYGAEISPKTQGSTPAVAPGGPAARAGLRPADVIQSLAGEATPSPDGLIQAIRTHEPGEHVDVVFERQGTRHETVLTLGSALS
jgi:putative serine protease PepD